MRQNLAEVIQNPDASHKFGTLINVRKSKDLKDAFKSGIPVETKMASEIKSRLDDYAISLGQEGEVYQKGLQEYAMGAQLEDAEEMVTSALRSSKRRYTSAGFAHALAMKADEIVKNPKKLRLWSPDAQARLDIIAQGGEDGQRLAQSIGRASLRGPMGLALGMLIGHPMVVAGIGEVGRQVARGMAFKSVEGLKDLIYAGGSEAKLTALQNHVTEKPFQKIVSQPATKQAAIDWSKAKGPAQSVAARTLAIAIARSFGTPTQVTRIEKELNDLNESDAPKTNRVETRY